MYCQNCGNELRQNLAFCNRCGARIGAELEKSQNAVLEKRKANVIENLSTSAGFVGVSGVIAIGALIYQLIQRSDITFSAVVLVIRHYLK